MGDDTLFLDTSSSGSVPDRSVARRVGPSPRASSEAPPGPDSNALCECVSIVRW